MPQRIRLSRAKGWTKPDGAIVVARGTDLGNPFRVYQHCKDGDWGVEDTGRFNATIGHGWTKEGAHSFAIHCYRIELDKVYPPESMARALLVSRLQGFDLCCWCPLDMPCHADVLLELANTEDAA